MLAVILYAMAGEPAVTGDGPFTDVPAGCWYTDAIVWAAQNGIVCGFGDGTFRPNEAVTRAQALKCYVLNIMTQDGETDGYDADDHVRAILEHAGPGVMDVCIANDAPVPPEIMEPYAKEGVSQLELRREDLEQMGLAVRTFPLLEPGRYIRHNSDALARAILSVWREFRN